MIRSNQKGFGVIGVLIVALILAGIGAIGYYVSIPKSSPTTNKPAQTTSPIEKSVLGEEEKSWVQYTASGYKIRLADGWVISNKEKTIDSFYTSNNDNLAYKKGIRAVVDNSLVYSRNDVYGIYIDYTPVSAPGNCKKQLENKKPTYLTVGGHEIYKSKVILTEDAPSLSAGDTSYDWCVDVSATHTLRIGYGINPSMQDHSEIIDRVLKTVE